VDVFDESATFAHLGTDFLGFANISEASSRGEMRMMVAILEGERGRRLQQGTELRPKPMVEICGVPIL